VAKGAALNGSASIFTSSNSCEPADDPNKSELPAEMTNSPTTMPHAPVAESSSNMQDSVEHSRIHSDPLLVHTYQSPSTKPDNIDIVANLAIYKVRLTLPQLKIMNLRNFKSQRKTCQKCPICDDFFLSILMVCEKCGLN